MYLINLCPLLPNQKFESFDENSAEKKINPKGHGDKCIPQPMTVK